MKTKVICYKKGENELKLLLSLFIQAAEERAATERRIQETQRAIQEARNRSHRGRGGICVIT